MIRPDRSKAMLVKHWTFAGLLLTYRCTARCASCYVCSGPTSAGDMSVDFALELWRGLIAASPHGCRIHIGGGEPFVDWPRLIELVRRARQQGLGPLESVETNGFWAVDERLVCDRLAELDAGGMGRLNISADPYHQQFVPIGQVRMLARIARDVLGESRVRVRWQDWLQEGFDTGPLPADQREEVFAAYAARGRDRLAGRAARTLAGSMPLKPWQEYADNSCADQLLRSRHVHVDPAGSVCPGVCAGLMLGRATDGASIPRLWRQLADEYDQMAVIGPLARAGPAALVPAAMEQGFVPEPGYAGRCHLCYSVRSWLFSKGYYQDRLGPGNIYAHE